LREELLAALHGLIGSEGQPDSGDLVGERLTRFSAKESAGFVLEWLETWWRDVAVLAGGGAPERLINGDRLGELNPWPARIGVRNAGACHRNVLSLRDALNVNVNAALAFEGLWLGFKQLLHDAGGVNDGAAGHGPANSPTGRSS
jgi:hypothetical protein